MSSSPDEPTGGCEMAAGIMGVIAPAVQQLDDQVKATRHSQVALQSRIQSLADLLHDMSQDQPYDLDVYVRKLDDSKRRVTSTAALLESVLDRLGKLQREIARETYAHKQTAHAPAPAPPKR